MATKCVPQMPQPATRPAPASHIGLAGPRAARARHQAHRGYAREETKDARQHDKTQIVLLGDAAQDMQHARILGRTGKDDAKLSRISAAE